ncbi:MAG: hypothetical protein HY270_09395 [Deltaproteobacteria bacterium]|nr:hypothetical protein [Deltaproteobacteria bacterium]
MSASQPTSLELQRLWESGQPAGALRAALANWDALLRQNNDLHWLDAALRSSGFGAEAFALQVHQAHRNGDESSWTLLIHNALQDGDPWWAQQLLREVSASSRDLEALRIEVELRVGDAAPLIGAWLQAHDDAAASAAAVSWYVRSGRIDEGVRLADEAGLVLWQARFALWRGNSQRARDFLASQPASVEARCIVAIATALDGDLPRAEAQLRELADTEVRAEACSWLATVLRKQKRHGEALQAAEAATSASGTFNLITRLERDLATHQRAAAERSSPLNRLLQSLGLWRPQFPKIAVLEHAAVLYPLGLKPDDSILALEPLLERFKGNHTVNLTTCDDGKLAAFRIPPDPRSVGESLQGVLWTRGIDAVRALYREYEPRVGGHPFFRIYQGEVELWMGEYEEAARIFRATSERHPTTKWAWIGWGAAVMLQGDRRAALKIWKKGLEMTGFAGPSLYIYRGECYRLEGEAKLARCDLDTALALKPRLSASINLALLEGTPERVEETLRECRAVAPLLMEEIGGTGTEKLEKVLHAMRGNRSSTMISYHLWGRLCRRAM